MEQKMTTKERWKAALRCEPIDRLPFWPKLDASYAPFQRKPFSAMSNDEIHAYIGSEPPIGLPSCVKEVSAARYRVEANGYNEHTTIESPLGTLTSTRRYDPGSYSWHPTEFPIKSRDDIEILTDVYEHTNLEVDLEGKAKSVEKSREAGDGGATLEAIGKSALMHFVEYLAGVENAHLFLADYEEDVITLFFELDRNLVSRIDLLVEHSPADMLMLVENTSTSLISPEQYRSYSAETIAGYAEKVRGSGKAMVLHMCGFLKALLPQLTQIGAHAFEAFTSPPVGNTPLHAGRNSSDDICLIGGTNAALWLEPAETIIAAIEADFEKLPHLRGIIPSSAGVMPPLAGPEKIRSVCQWINRYRKN